jgi:hypothetical protein
MQYGMGREFLSQGECGRVFTDPVTLHPTFSAGDLEHDRQYTYNVTLRHVHATTVAVEKQ